MLPKGPPVPSFVSTYFWMRRPFQYLEWLAKKYGEPFTLGIVGFPKIVVVYSPETVKHVFADDGETFAAGRFNRSLQAILGDKSVLMLDGKEHLRHRRLLLPPFHGERMQRYGQAMLDATDAAIDTWREGVPFSLHPHMQEITLRVIVRTVFGIEDGPRQVAMMAATRKTLALAAWPPLLIPFMQKDLGAWSPWGKFKRAVAVGDEILHAEIRDRRRTGTRRDDVLSLLLDAKDEAGKPMTDAELRDELATLLVAGHETTATALAWAVRWTLDTPGLLARVRRDIADAKAKDRSTRLTAARAAELPLVDAIAREAMRLNPVIPIVGRVLEKPAVVAGYELPEGTPIVCGIYLAHRREDTYPDARRFDPDRFLGKKILPNEFFPFGGGVRRCIGMAFALYEMRIVLARIFERAELTLAPTRPIKEIRRSITLMPSEGLRVRLERRIADSTPAGEVSLGA
jgi:cytochrome P450